MFDYSHSIVLILAQYFFSQWIYTENADIIQLCNWLGHLQSSLPEGINSFRDIEFLDDRWGSHQEPILSLSPPSPQAWSVLLPNILKVFPALEHLCASLGSSLEGFTYHRGLRKWLHSEHGRKATRRMMKQWLTEGALEDSRKVPKLTLRSWKAPSRDSLLQSTIEHFEERIIILRTIE
jgi:hypothetical protein